MAASKREQISLYEEAKAGMSSLAKQTAQVFVGLLVMLVLTGGNPPGWVVVLSFLTGIGFVAWSENQRLNRITATLDVGGHILPHSGYTHPPVSHLTRNSDTTNIAVGRTAISAEEEYLSILKQEEERRQPPTLPTPRSTKASAKQNTSTPAPKPEPQPESQPEPEQEPQTEAVTTDEPQATDDA